MHHAAHGARHLDREPRQDDQPAPGTAAPPLPRRRFLAYGLTDGEPSAAVVVHGSALPLVFEDDTWTRFGFGERFGTRDAHAQAPARRNVFAHARAGDPVPAGAWAEVLQRRGVVLVPCDTALERATAGRVASLSHPAQTVRAELLLPGVLPGATVVPAAIVALGRAQERGRSYVYPG